MTFLVSSASFLPCLALPPPNFPLTLFIPGSVLPQTQDYYTYTAVKYAKDAGHETIVELLGGEEEGEGWVEVEEVYMGADEGEDENDPGPTGGLWIRHIDPQTVLAYYMNDETGTRQRNCLRRECTGKVVLGALVE